MSYTRAHENELVSKYGLGYVWVSCNFQYKKTELYSTLYLHSKIKVHSLKKSSYLTHNHRYSSNIQNITQKKEERDLIALQWQNNELWVTNVIVFMMTIIYSE